MTARHGVSADFLFRRSVPIFGTLEIERASSHDSSIIPHAHDEFTFALVERGVNKMRIRGAARVVAAGQLVIVHPGEIHDGADIAAGGWAYRVFYPPALAFAQISTDNGDLCPPMPFFRSPVVDDPWLARAVVRLHETLERDGCALEGESRLLETLDGFTRRHAAAGYGLRRAAGSEPRAVRVVREFIEAHFTGVVRLATLAELAELSPFHLIRVFRAAMGVPPYLYLLQLRLSYALTLLREGRGLSEVAFMAGFSDQSHLTRHFKRAVGIPPGRYVRGIREYERAM